jgi:hypothetical protein
MGIVVIHQLPVTPETLLLRLLGRGKVQTRAISEVESLRSNDRLKSIILEQLYNLQQNLFVQNDVDLNVPGDVPAPTSTVMLVLFKYTVAACVFAEPKTIQELETIADIN